MLFKIILLCGTFILNCHGENMFKNPGMEDSDIEGSYGHAWGYNFERVNDSYTGDYAIKVSDR